MTNTGFRVPAWAGHPFLAADADGAADGFEAADAAGVAPVRARTEKTPRATAAARIVLIQSLSVERMNSHFRCDEPAGAPRLPAMTRSDQVTTSRVHHACRLPPVVDLKRIAESQRPPTVSRAVPAPYNSG